jgi:hypothetical protein
MARTNLSLGNLYRAVSGSVRTTQAVSIGGLNGGGTNVAFTGFATDSITVNTPTYTYIVESTTENASFQFGTSGSNFSTKVATQPNNYTCSFNNGNFSVGSINYTANTFPITPAAVTQTTYSEASSVLTMGYADGYNINATNHGTTYTKTLYAVDVYNTINQPDFCLLFGTKVTKADGSVINIEDLTVGDQIKAWEPNGVPSENQSLESTDVDWRFYFMDNLDGNDGLVTVKDMVFNFASGYYSINNGAIKATGTHPLWVYDSEISKYRFKLVEDLLIGDMLIRDDNGVVTEVEIYDIEIVTEDVEIVTLNVETVDTFLAGGFVSHNKGTTTQPYIPSSGLRMYVDPGKTASYQSADTADLLDLSGWNTGIRPAGVQNAAGISGGNPAYQAGSLRKDKYFALNGTNQFWYKDTSTNINGGIAQFNTTSGTIHTWIRPGASIGTTSRFIFDYAGFFGLAVESSNSTAYNYLKFYGSSLGNSAQISITALTSGVNYMVSAAFQPSGTVTIYLDGTSVGTFSSSAFSAPSSTNYLTIGANSARTSFWNAGIGPVLFYNTLQNSTLVSQVYSYFSPSMK